MTLLFPRHSSPELKPFVVPLGQMMLAYGRAYEAVVALAMLRSAGEEKARTIVQGTVGLPKKMRRLFRGTVSEETLKEISEEVSRFSKIATERHNLVHGEWWFDVFEGNRLSIRRIQDGNPVHTEYVTPGLVEEWAKELDAVADSLDHLAYFISRNV
jgi:hypothetical protein